VIRLSSRQSQLDRLQNFYKFEIIRWTGPDARIRSLRFLELVVAPPINSAGKRFNKLHLGPIQRIYNYKSGFVVG
jgi:hypothetical protein